MQVDVLFFRGCPNHRPTVDLVRQVARDLGIVPTIREVEVRGSEAARRLRFPGSPTVHVNGEDIEPPAGNRAPNALSCRMYGTSGIPPRELILAAMTRRTSA